MVGCDMSVGDTTNRACATEPYSALSSLLMRFVGERYPEHSTVPPLLWRPQGVAERGDWWSDWCLELAKRLRTDPRPLSEELVSRVNEGGGSFEGMGSGGTVLRATEGYLTLSCESLPFVSSPPRRKGRRVIICAPLPVHINRWLLMRTVAAAAIQAHLAAVRGEAVEIWLGSERRFCFDECCSEHDLSEILGWAWTTNEKGSGVIREGLEQLCREVRELGVQGTLWFMPTTLPPSSFKMWYRESSIEEGRISLCCPSGGWFIDPPAHRIDERVLKSGRVEADKGRLWGLALHLAGGQSARDIDQYAGWFDEFDSLPWSGRAAVERLGRRFREAPGGMYRNHGAGHRSALLFGAFLDDAVSWGSVPVFVEHARQMLAAAHRSASLPPSSFKSRLAGVSDEEACLLLATCGRFSSIF